MAKIEIKIIYISLFLFFAQGKSEIPFSFGTYSLGGNFFYSYKSSEGIYDKQSILSLNSQFEYFLSSNISVGISTIFLKTDAQLYSETEYGLGPSISYFFPYNKVSPFISVGYLWFVEPEVYDSQFDISSGIDFFVNSNVALEPIINYKYSIQRPLDDRAYFATMKKKLKSLILEVGIGLKVYF